MTTHIIYKETFKYNYALRIFYFLIISLVCLLVGSLLMGIVMGIGGSLTTRILRIATIVQDLTVFILPAIITAVVVNRLPASMLGVDKMFTLKQLILAVGVMVAATPAMNLLIDWNANITLPESMAGIEAALKASEAQAQVAVELMLAGDGWAQTLIAVLIVGALAGLSEELYFRGVLQRLIGSGTVNIHVAIWVTAVLFSLFHMQFYGFFPRILLGAFFGYLLYWTGSLWLPIIMHTLNNSVYVITTRHSLDSFNQFGVAQGDIWLIIASVIVTALLIKIMHNAKCIMLN